MKEQIKKFLEFNGKSIYFKDVDGTWWIAIKPICEALGVDYIRQFKNTKEHPILGQLLSEQTMVAADNRLRKMVCLPEFNVYGWLFSVQSPSLDLINYQWKCYELLYNHFHGTITGRLELLDRKAHIKQEIEQLKKTMQQSNDFYLLEIKKAELYKTNRGLAKLDQDYIAGQQELWQTPTFPS